MVDCLRICLKSVLRKPVWDALHELTDMMLEMCGMSRSARMRILSDQVCEHFGEILDALPADVLLVDLFLTPS